LRRTKAGSDVESKPLYYVTVRSALRDAICVLYGAYARYSIQNIFPSLSPFPFLSPSFLQQWTDACIGAFVRRLHPATWVQPPPPRATLNSCNGRGLGVTRVRTKTTLCAFRPKGLRSDKGKYVWHNGVNGNHQFYNESAPKYTRRHFRGDATRTSYSIPPFEGPRPRGRRCHVVSVRSVTRE